MKLSTDAVIDILKAATEFFEEIIDRGDTLTVEQVKSIGLSANTLKIIFNESLESLIYQIKNQCLPGEDPSIPEKQIFDFYEKNLIAISIIILIFLIVQIVSKLFPDDKQ